MSATRRVLVGALLGAGIAATLAPSFPGTKAALSDSEQVRITVTADTPGSPPATARSAVAADPAVPDVPTGAPQSAEPPS